MKKDINRQITRMDLMGYVGEFQRENPICKKFCILSIRCAIEKDQSRRMEMLEDLVNSEGFLVKIQ